MSGHTPGPWTVNGFGGEFVVIARLLPDGVAVSAHTSKRIDEIANARLIAAAPDLLEACRLSQDLLVALAGGGEVLRKVGAAIAKAEGR